MKKATHYKDSTKLKLINVLVEYLVLIAAYFIGGYIRVIIPTAVAQPFWYKEILHYTYISLIGSAIIVVFYLTVGDFSTVHIRNPKVELVWIIFVQIIGTLIMSGLLFIVNDGQFSRFWLGIIACVSIVLIYLKRVLFQIIAVKFFYKFVDAYKVLIIGNGNYARRFYAELMNVGEQHYSLVGYLAQNESKSMTGYLGTKAELQAVLSSHETNIVVIAEDVMSSTSLKEILSICSVYGIPTYVIPAFGDYLSNTFQWANNDSFLQTFNGDLKLFPVSAMNKSDILGVNVAVTNMEKTVQDISDHLESWRGNYICVSNVHTTVMAHDSEAYRKVQNGAVMALPDGGPLSSYSRSNGSKDAKRVTGPDLMKEILVRSGEHGWKHYFYGSTQETLDKLKAVLERSYPGAEVVGMISPPFRELTPDEDNAFIDQINEAAPDFIWVGLGAPKQEVWMAAHKGRVKGLMIGVGAAFDYEAGNIKRAPKWMQKLSLEWLYRLMQDPKRLFKRYIVTNAKYLWLTRR